MNKIRVLWISDGVIPTGFSRVSHSIIKYLPKDKYEILHLAINYDGDPHPFNHKIYTAKNKGDIYGTNRIKEFSKAGVDLIFILNDLWITTIYLEEIKNVFKENIPPVVAYFPVDAKGYDSEWFRHFDIVKEAVVYTKFGYDVVKEEAPRTFDFKIVPHGVDTSIFYKMDKTREELKKEFFPPREDFEDSFIVLNANRNQPRKRIDIAIKGFALFSENKPFNVKYYHHAGISDVGWDVLKLTAKLKKLGMDKRLVLTSFERGVQRVTDEKLNMIYNCTDIGLNTSMGEGFGLPNVEHATTGAPQIVSGNSASLELFQDCGLIIPPIMELEFERVQTTGSLVTAEAVAEKLEIMYNSPELRKELSEKSLAKFLSDKYRWENIAKQWDEIFESVI